MTWCESIDVEKSVLDPVLIFNLKMDENGSVSSALGVRIVSEGNEAAPEAVAVRSIVKKLQMIHLDELNKVQGV